MTTWSVEKIAFLKENYPRYGRDKCAELMGLTTGQVRTKASRLGLKARGVSEAYHNKNIEHGKKLKGRKRPDQSLVMKRLHAEGKLALNPEQRARAVATFAKSFTDEKIESMSQAMKIWHANNEHPRGALGMKHTQETKDLLARQSEERYASLTEDQKAERMMKIMKTRVKNGTYSPERQKTTWKSGWREIGGVRKYYRSKWEANYAYYLEWLKAKGEIIEWQHEPTTFWFEGIKRGCVSYLPDFRVVEKNGEEAYHEVKGWMDDRSKTKIKRMAKYHPNVNLIVIDSKAYNKLKRQVQSIVPGWEQ